MLDETSTPATLTPVRGRGPCGQRVVGRVSRGRWQDVTLVATQPAAGIGPGLHLRRALDRDAVDVFVTVALMPTLQPGDVVVLDNLTVHESARARDAIEAVGVHQIFLPAFSPDFRPIEQAFAKSGRGALADPAKNGGGIVLEERGDVPDVILQSAHAIASTPGSHAHRIDVESSKRVMPVRVEPFNAKRVQLTNARR